MSKTIHRIYIYSLVAIVLFATTFLIIKGLEFYQLPLNERFFHPDYDNLKPSGFWGHGLGIIGTLLIIIGILSYMLRKRAKFMRRWGLLKHWLEFHIFLCTLGPIMVLFHTSFKFGGIVSISFWSMVAVFLSGIIGRFIYIQIPRTIEGRELSLEEVKSLKTDIDSYLKGEHKISDDTRNAIVKSTKRRIKVEQDSFIKDYLFRRNQYKDALKKVKRGLKNDGLSYGEIRKIMKIVHAEIALNKRIDRLDRMKNIFKYWHVAHLPFAIVMMIIMIIHVIITVSFGFRWIF